jgi:hypothetical protein
MPCSFWRRIDNNSVTQDSQTARGAGQSAAHIGVAVKISSEAAKPLIILDRDALAQPRQSCVNDAAQAARKRYFVEDSKVQRGMCVVAHSVFCRFLTVE